jgi:hypothetical protein
MKTKTKATKLNIDANNHLSVRGEAKRAIKALAQRINHGKGKGR